MRGFGKQDLARNSLCKPNAEVVCEESSLIGCVDGANINLASFPVVILNFRKKIRQPSISLRAPFLFPVWVWGN